MEGIYERFEGISNIFLLHIDIWTYLNILQKKTW